MMSNLKEMVRVRTARLRLLIASVLLVGALFLGFAPSASASSATDAQNVTETVTAYVAIIPALVNALLPALIPLVIYGLIFTLFGAVGYFVVRLLSGALSHGHSAKGP